jgi:DNA-binding response OmpR family regulator
MNSRPTIDPPRDAGKRILIIEDDQDLLELAHDVLCRAGHVVDTAADGETGLRKISAQRYDLILCDWKMPRLGGQQVLDSLLATDPETARRIVFMSGDGMNETTQAFLKERNQAWLPKPFTLDEFRAVVTRNC